jgi:hypothetical protein
MKLRAVHLFIILIGALLLSSVLGSVREGMTNEKTIEDDIDDGLENVEDKATEWWDEVTGKSPDTRKNTSQKNGSSHKSSHSSSHRNSNQDRKQHSQYIGPAGDVVDVYGRDDAGRTPERRPPPELTYPSYNTDTNNTILKGIPRSEIPDGDEDLYILKSQVVPPVCPACPPVVACPTQTECPPCRPCGRCPEPSFECKKVPNYDAGMKNEYLPRPILADFSQFGM